MRTLTLLLFGIALGGLAHGQFFTLRNPYTGAHRAFSYFDDTELNQFVVQFNQMWGDDLTTGFSQYKGSELGQTFSTSGLRFVWGKKKVQWTASSDAAFGAGRHKNVATFKNGVEQQLLLRYGSNQINASFGVALKDNKYWLEGLYCTNLSKVTVEYSTFHLNDVESFGPEYRLNGVYTGTIKTMELGAQASARYKRYVFYSRILYPIVTTGPDKEERFFTDERSSRAEPNNFPANYNNYVGDPDTYIAENQGLSSDNFKGLSFGFGMFIIIGKYDR